MALPIPFPSGELIQQKTSAGFARNLWTPSAFDYDVFEDKFWGDALLGLYPNAKTSGGSVTLTEHSENAYLKIVANAGSGNYAGQGMGLQFTGDRGVLAEFIIKLPADVSDMKFEVGLTDADDDAGAINQKAAATTFRATDTAVFVMDTSDSSSIKVAFITKKDGVADGVQTRSIQDIVASTTLRLAVRVEGDSVSAYINGTQVAGHANAIEGGNALTPWVFSQARTSSERILQLHKWRVTQPAY